MAYIVTYTSVDMKVGTSHRRTSRRILSFIFHSPHMHKTMTLIAIVSIRESYIQTTKKLSKKTIHSETV